MGKPPRSGVFRGVSGVPLARAPGAGTWFVPACSLSQAAAKEARAAPGAGAQPSSEEGVAGSLSVPASGKCCGLCVCVGGYLLGGPTEEGLSFQ